MRIKHGIYGATLAVCIAAPSLYAEVRNSLTTTQSALKHTLEHQQDTLKQLFGDKAVQDAYALYEGLKFQPLWQDKLFTNPAKNVIKLFDTAKNDGLYEENYHADLLSDILKEAEEDKSLKVKITKDLLFSTALFRYLQDLNYGQTEPPAYTNHAVKTVRPEGYLQALFLKTINSSNMPVDARTAKIQSPEYLALQRALVEFTTAENNGGWTSIPPLSTVLKVGQTDATRVPLIIKRLEAEHYLTHTLPTSIYTAEIAAAVKTFQKNHSLQPDGIFGNSTRDAMNISATERKEQIMLAMERWRWLPDDMGNIHIRVNIPAFQLTVMEQNKPAFNMPVIVGSPRHQTPTMHTLATDVTFNPYWYIPHSIVEKELLQQLKNKPELFYLNNYEASYGSYKAEAVYNIFSILETADAEGESLRFRQRPGTHNPLGRARIGIQNNDAIYLHDTPDKSLFWRENRALSHGCIRLSDPKKLVSYLLQSNQDWSETDTNRLFSLKQPQDADIVDLQNPVPVHLVYWTAWIEHDHVRFATDIYGHDKALKTALFHKQTPNAHPLLASR